MKKFLAFCAAGVVVRMLFEYAFPDLAWSQISAIVVATTITAIAMAHGFK